MKAPSHPLDPLTGLEIQAAANACKIYAQEQDLGTPFFHTITLQVGFGNACYPGSSASSA